MRQRQRRPGALVAFFGALLQPHLAGRDDGDLRHGEDAVGEDEEEDDEEFDADAPIVPFDSTVHADRSKSGRSSANPPLEPSMPEPSPCTRIVR